MKNFIFCAVFRQSEKIKILDMGLDTGGNFQKALFLHHDPEN